MKTRTGGVWGRAATGIAGVLLLGASAALGAGAAGALDTTFGDGGIVTTSGVSAALDAVVQPAGASERYLVAGTPWAVLAYTPTGSLDTTFGEGGDGVVRLFTSDPNAPLAYDLSLDDQNRVVVGGTSTVRAVTTYDRKGRPVSTLTYRGMTVVRLTDAGLLDTSFNGTGVATVWAGSPDGWNEVGVAAVAVPDALGGGVIAAGTRFYVQTAATKKSAAVINRSTFLAKFRQDGTLDPAFGTGGIACESVSSEPRPRALALQSDGKVIVGEHTDLTAGTNAAAHTWVLARFTATGALDTSFGTGGRVVGSTYLHGIAVGGDDSIVAVGGIAPSEGRIARYLANGSPDTSFDGDGEAGFSGGSPNLALGADASVVFCGQALVGSTYYGLVGRVAADGSPDGSFGAGGYAPLLSAGWWAQAATEAADGIVVVGSAGSGSNQVFVARYGK